MQCCIVLDLTKRLWVSPGLATEPLSPDRDDYRGSPVVAAPPARTWSLRVRHSTKCGNRDGPTPVNGGLVVWLNGLQAECARGLPHHCPVASGVRCRSMVVAACPRSRCVFGHVGRWWLGWIRGVLGCTGGCTVLTVVPLLAAPSPSLTPVRNWQQSLAPLLAVLLSARLETRTKESKELASRMADPKPLLRRGEGNYPSRWG